MTEHSSTIPAAPVDLESKITQIQRWIEGYVDDKGERHAGLIEMVGDLYEELKVRRERREAMVRGFTVGGVIALLSAALAWLKEHLK